MPESWLGVWTLNVQKSVAAGADPKGLRPTMTTISRDAGGMKSSTLTTVAAGRTVVQEVTARFDGTQYSVSNSSMTRVYRAIDDRAYECTQFSNGKELNTNRVVMSSDGKTRTMTRVARDWQGRTITTMTVWDKR